MKIRYINSNDCEDIFKWRNDFLTREMSINKNLISFEDHKKWFNKSLKNKNRHLLIAEQRNEKLGICRFDLNNSVNESEVSININPNFRKKGYGKKFLKKAIEFYLKNRLTTLKAKIKIDNKTSYKLFSSVGFSELSVSDGIITMEFIRKLSFYEINNNDIDILYGLLKKRNYSISHKELPNYSEHKKFVESNPYLHWYRFSLSQKTLGTFYIKDDNSIGLNINEYTNEIIKEILYFIKNNFDPQTAIPSKIPNYFYMNISSRNENLMKTIEDIGLMKIQSSFKL